MISNWLYIKSVNIRNLYSFFLAIQKTFLCTYLHAGVWMPSPITIHTITYFLPWPNCKDTNMLLSGDRKTQTQFGGLLLALSTLKTRIIQEKKHPHNPWDSIGSQNRWVWKWSLHFIWSNLLLKADQPLCLFAQGLFQWSSEYLQGQGSHHLSGP